MYDSSSENVSEMTSLKNSKSSKRRYDVSRDAQLLTLEKKQLELVIGNSMRKI